MFDGIGVEVGGDVGVVERQAVVAVEEDLGHGVDLVAIVLALVFSAEVVEADAGLGVAVFVDRNALVAGVFADDGEAMLGKLPGDLPCGDDAVSA